MEPVRVLLIDDDCDLREWVKLGLQARGYAVKATFSGTQGLILAYQEHPHVVLLDLMLPGMDGLETLSRLREVCDVPVVVISARTGEEDVVRALSLGADDYLRKPFGIEELGARLRNVLAHHGRVSPCEPYDDGRLRVDFSEERTWLGGEEVPLSSTEFALLSCLAAVPGKLVPYQELLRSVWGEAYENDRDLLYLYICYLRKKLHRGSDDHRYIRCQSGKGYWLCPRRVAGSQSVSKKF
jgi:two-component system KDP operon response regulator KdpE